MFTFSCKGSFFCICKTISMPLKFFSLYFKMIRNSEGDWFWWIFESDCEKWQPKTEKGYLAQILYRCVLICISREREIGSLLETCWNQAPGDSIEPVSSTAAAAPRRPRCTAYASQFKSRWGISWNLVGGLSRFQERWKTENCKLGNLYASPHAIADRPSIMHWTHVQSQIILNLYENLFFEYKENLIELKGWDHQNVKIGNLIIFSHN